MYCIIFHTMLYIPVLLLLNKLSRNSIVSQLSMNLKHMGSYFIFVMKEAWKDYVNVTLVY